MPIYEYRCLGCNRKSEIITFRASEEIPTPACRFCGSESMERVPSRVRVRLSEETRMERLTDPSRLSGLDENDPASMARWMKSIGREMDEDIDVDSMVEEAMEEREAGESGPETSPGYDED